MEKLGKKLGKKLGLKLGLKTGMLIGLLAGLATSCSDNNTAVDAGADGARDTNTSDGPRDGDANTSDGSGDATISDSADAINSDEGTDVDAIASDAPTEAPATDALVDQPQDDVAARTFTVGGTITGLTGSGLVLRNNGGNSLAVPANATSFTFTTSIASGASYTVSILTQPASPPQLCSVGNATGTVGAGNVTGVTITCAAATFNVGGSIVGLAGTGLVLRNGGIDLPVPSNAITYMFPAQATGSAYAITVAMQPASPPQLCTVVNATGTVGRANLTTATVTCVTQYTVAGTITGLAGTVVLRNTITPGDVTSDITIAPASAGAPAPFSFAVRAPSGLRYTVSVLTNPTSPSQICRVTANDSAVISHNVTDVGVTCVTQYTIGGTVTGLTGAGLVLQNNGVDNRTVPANANRFTFPSLVSGGASFGPVTVSRQPSNPPQYCTVTGGMGGPIAGNVNSIAVNCATLTLGGTISGLTSSGLLLRSGSGPTLPVMADDTTFTFPTPVAANTTFGDVTVAQQPTAQNCAVSGGSGSVGTTSVESVTVTCTDNFHCLSAPENTRLVLPCPDGEMISAVDFAAYGVDPPIGACGSYTPEVNDDAGVCGGDATGDLEIVSGLCPVGSTTCTVDVASQEDGDTFPDNCPGMGKAVTVQITCVPM